MSTQYIFLRFLIISLVMTTTNLSVSAAQVISKYPIWLRFGSDSVRVLFTSGNYALPAGASLDGVLDGQLYRKKN